jgi:putative flippase GtrA
LSRQTRTQLAAFVAVGSTAAAVHFSVVLLLVAWLAWPPLLANVLGWLVAFGVSLGGHLAVTFRDQQPPRKRAAARFFAVSAGGFALNETAYAMLLGFTGLGYAAALALVLVGVAVATFVLSRHWAFLGSATR